MNTLRKSEQVGQVVPLAEQEDNLSRPPAPARPRAHARGTAAENGHCPDCDEPIRVGNPIGVVGDKWVCELCVLDSYRHGDA